MLDDPRLPLQDAGLREGDHVTALATRLPSVTGTRADAETGGAFASWFRGDDRATTWGHPQFGGLVAQWYLLPFLVMGSLLK